MGRVCVCVWGGLVTSICGRGGRNYQREDYSSHQKGVLFSQRGKLREQRCWKKIDGKRPHKRDLTLFKSRIIQDFHHLSKIR